MAMLSRSQSMDNGHTLTPVDDPHCTSVSTPFDDNSCERTEHSHVTDISNSWGEGDDNYTTSAFYESFHLLTRCMRVCGLHYDKRRMGKRGWLLFAYCYITALVPLLMLAITLCTLRTVHAVDVTLFTVLNCIVFNLLCSVNVIACLLNSYRPKAVRKFFAGFSRLSSFGGALVQVDEIRKVTQVVLGVSAVVYVVSVSLFCYAIITTNILDFVGTALAVNSTTAVKSFMVIAICIAET